MKNPINHSVFIVIDGVSASVVNYFAEHNITGGVLRYNDITSRDFVCHKSPPHSRNRLSLWGRNPQSPVKGEVTLWGKIYESPSA